MHPCAIALIVSVVSRRNPAATPTAHPAPSPNPFCQAGYKNVIQSHI